MFAHARHSIRGGWRAIDRQLAGRRPIFEATGVDRNDVPGQWGGGQQQHQLQDESNARIVSCRDEGIEAFLGGYRAAVSFPKPRWLADPHHLLVRSSKTG